MYCKVSVYFTRNLNILFDKKILSLYKAKIPVQKIFYRFNSFDKKSESVFVVVAMLILFRVTLFDVVTHFLRATKFRRTTHIRTVKRT